MGPCGSCWRKCSECFMREDDTVEDVHIKRVMIPLSLWLFGIVFVFMIGNAAGEDYLLTGILVSSTCMNLMLPIGGALGKRMGPLLDCFLLFNAINNVVNDAMEAATMQPRTWPLVVMLLDTALVFERYRTIPAIILITLSWFCVEFVTGGYRVGLYDAIQDATQVPPQTSACDCAHPPCARGWEEALGTLLIYSVVLLTDLYLTRGFATDLRVQLRRVKSSVEVAAEVTASLAKYDVDSAEKAINSGSDLPQELTCSLLQLVFNLKSYKAYLPHSCLVGNTEAVDDAQNSSDQSGGLPSPISAQKEDHDPEKGDGSGESGSSAISGSTRGSVTSYGSYGRAQSKHSLVPEKHVNLKAAPRRARVSLAVGNMIGYLSGDLAGQPNSMWISRDVARWCSTVAEVKGVVDLIGGDRRYASFNARQVCGDHA
eukprot:Hpha_TRINITY_DN16462_c5_g1::TRINITY_DN16462_c5_g1_i2::g.161945::m.161945